MEHNFPLISTIAAGFGLALVFGFLAERFRIPALVGYLFAGIVIAPTTPGFVGDVHLAAQLSEIGVMLLMFGVGLHFSLDDLLSVKRIAIPGAVVQMGVATVLGALLASWWGWSLGAALVFGVSLSCASTVVLLKALEARGILASMNGRIAVGWLVMEDLATVLVLVLLPPLAGLLGGGEAAAPGGSLWWTIGKTLLQVSLFIGLMLLVGRRILPWLIWQVARTGSRELFTLSVITAAIGIAYGAAELFGVSFALGAFFAGMVLRESRLSHRAASESLPLRDAFAVLFFVAVGMLFEPSILIKMPLHVLGVVAIIILCKSLAAAVLVVAFRYPLRTALTISASLAQIGEFSFILAGLGLSLGLLPPEGQSLIVAGALISIALNPVVFASVPPLSRWLLARSALARRLDARPDPYAELPHDTEHHYLQGQVVLVGYGRIGEALAASMLARQIPFVVVEQNRERVDQLRERGIKAVCGDAAEPDVLVQAHIMHAAMLVVASDNPAAVPAMVDTALTLNPDIDLLLQAASEADWQELQQQCNATVIFGEDTLTQAMQTHVEAFFARRETHEDAVASPQ
ncbi:Kef family K(+) transporter [Laribacter hongkongensis]|uniref:YbaL family putative K(+) efflux transporter n=2 Tax=Laribacter hongkongensis TaxID=168471 RepID=UPI001EFC5208|nr:YbaL family putative K(+) efflux transporter [Laribacter hongkongensis]MCG8993348.1 Kef family K(+) transporter [Laribacter hongkongensis]MCG8999189.1 Kef family K(+) transporter [Laribacter hongkongensis]MCG9002385.1 Kef family K(+) transporter [Laribacter hongkongensis]MCG9005513.1 Kef family K(+) transporter [Laribacter hongkongensis]MCG9007998.1 Kef family K(+) transporter [Laribacter hongkongensis]